MLKTASISEIEFVLFGGGKKCFCNCQHLDEISSVQLDECAVRPDGG
jgi:hypothetical protein